MLHRRNLTALVLTSAVAGWLVPSEAEAASGRELFAIARSKNANIVRYVARVNRRGTLDVQRPIEAHWVMRAEDGRREELSWAERNLAYGFTASSVESDGCTLSLVAFESRQVRIERRGGSFRALLAIRGQRATLKRIFVQATEGALLPTVQYVDLFGVGLDGGPVSERVSAG